MGAAEGIFEATEVAAMAAVDQFDHDYYLTQIQAALDQSTIEELWEKGKGMPAEEVAAYVLEGAGLAGDSLMS